MTINNNNNNSNITVDNSQFNQEVSQNEPINYNGKLIRVKGYANIFKALKEEELQLN